MKRITIVGGGIAGLALGIALRRAAVPVELFEAGAYPRHKVCGEFISGKGSATIERLGLSDLVHQAAARQVESASFYTAKRCSFRRGLPQPALGISRWALDAALATHFEMLGGKLHTNTRANASDDGVVYATGRRRQVQSNGARWFGVKGHACNVKLDADLEMHFVCGGYVGLCQLADGVVNVCGLFWEKPQDSSPPAMLSGPPDSILCLRLREAEWITESFVAVAGLPIHCGLKLDGEARVGDAVAMMPPLTGNGMSFAFESAELATGPLIEFARGEIDWKSTCERLAEMYRRRFRWRLCFANALHKLWVRRPRASLWVAEIPTVWKLAFAMTR